MVDCAKLEVAHVLHECADQVDLLGPRTTEELLHVHMLVVLVFFGENFALELTKAEIITELLFCAYFSSPWLISMPKSPL